MIMKGNVGCSLQRVSFLSYSMRVQGAATYGSVLRDLPCSKNSSLGF
jgi:hypothetical protein